MAETIYVFYNYLKDGSLFKNAEFADSLISLLNSKISNNSIKGAFYTFYSEQSGVFIPNIKIGLWSESENSIVTAVSDISELLGQNSIIKSVIRPFAVDLPNSAKKVVDFIACFSFKILNFARDKSNSEIYEIYYKIFSKMLVDLRINYSQALIDFNEFREKHSHFPLSKFDVNNITISYDVADVKDFSDEFNAWIKYNVTDYQDVWFICDRLFHHCNNSNNKFGVNEHNIFSEFIAKVNGPGYQFNQPIK